MATDTIEKSTTQEVTPTEHTRNVRHFRPNVDIVERADELRVYADMPGASSDGIDVNFENGMLTIHGKVSPRQGEEANFLTREYGVGDFYRTFRVSEAVDAKRISAEFNDGVLTLHLPKVEAVKLRRIAVKGE